VSALSAGSGARRRALVVLNRGIGNRVMSAPLFANLGDKVDFALIGSAPVAQAAFRPLVTSSEMTSSAVSTSTAPAHSQVRVRPSSAG
jgi:hypothetical protein